MQNAIRVASLCRALVQHTGTLMGIIAGWGFILCSVFITFDVVSRRFLGFSSNATNDLSGYILAFGIAWALAHTLSMRAHVRLDVIVNVFPPNARYVLHLTSLLALAVFAAFLTKGAYDLTAESFLFRATDISALKTPLVIPQGLWAAGIGVFFVLCVLMLIENVLLVIAGRGKEAEANLHARTYREEAAEVLDAVGAPSRTNGMPP